MTAQAFLAILATPIGRVGIAVAGGRLAEIALLPDAGPTLDPADPLACEAAAQLRRYFADPGFRFDLPLAPATTPFRRRVREALLAIPAGSALTYGELAQRIGSAPRAAGGACRTNPLPIVVPCHRVVAHAGLGGYSGGLDIKRRLLELEGVRH